ncbi:MAG: hypothetical protein DRQ55_02615 [Planctomycetota bacterium]|nr:MAG: hypothetical protein DRQ55_02615 [Planctomycetota bacterium]
MIRGPERGGLAALLEALRAPLLLSPLADVYCGWVLALAVQPLDDSYTGWAGRLLALSPQALVPLGGAALAGCLLLAAGMAQNALVDREDDAARKPTRPLPRGAVSVGGLRLTWALCVLGALALLLPVSGGLAAAGFILTGSAVYHLWLKQKPAAGSLVLGLLRGACMGLGLLAARSFLDQRGGPFAEPHPDIGPALLGCALYALYVFGAALHASTDDEQGPTDDALASNDGKRGSDDDSAPGGTSAAGLTVSGLVLALWSGVCLARLASGAGWHAGLGGVLLIWALLRMARAAHSLPPPAVTGVVLSGLHLLHAGVVALLLGPAAAALPLLLFALSRALLRVYPPS